MKSSLPFVVLHDPSPVSPHPLCPFHAYLDVGVGFERGFNHPSRALELGDALLRLGVILALALGGFSLD